MKKILVICAIIVLVSAAISCEKFLPQAPEDDEILDGPVEGLSPAEKDIFLRGDRAFNDDIFTTENGLGPLFVATSCYEVQHNGNKNKIQRS